MDGQGAFESGRESRSVIQPRYALWRNPAADFSASAGVFRMSRRVITVQRRATFFRGADARVRSGPSGPALPREREADVGVGRGPGGPPHIAIYSTPYFSYTSRR